MASRGFDDGGRPRGWQYRPINLDPSMPAKAGRAPNDPRMVDNEYRASSILVQPVRHGRLHKPSERCTYSFATRPDDDHEGVVFLCDPDQKPGWVSAPYVIAPASGVIAQRFCHLCLFLREPFARVRLPVADVGVDRIVAETHSMDNVQAGTTSIGKVHGDIERPSTLRLAVVADNEGRKWRRPGLDATNAFNLWRALAGGSSEALLDVVNRALTHRFALRSLAPNIDVVTNGPTLLWMIVDDEKDWLD